MTQSSDESTARTGEERRVMRVVVRMVGMEGSILVVLKGVLGDKVQEMIVLQQEEWDVNGGELLKTIVLGV